MLVCSAGMSTSMLVTRMEKAAESAEIEANIFAAHLLLDEKKLMNDIKEGYTYQQLASLYDVNVNLMIFKLNEMHRMGLPVNKNIANSKFFTKIDGRDELYGNLY